MSKSKFNNFFKFILICLVFYYGRYTSYILIFLFNIKKVTLSNNVLLSLFSNFLECLFFIWLFRKELKIDFAKFRKNIKVNLDTGLKYWIAGMLLMFISNLVIAHLFSNLASQNEVLVDKMLVAFPVAMFINTAFLGPFIEEIVFRGGFRLVIKKKWVYVLISGFVFGLMHVIFSFTDIRQFLYVFPYAFVGCSYALCYYDTDTIFTPIIIHIIHNTLLTLISIL